MESLEKFNHLSELDRKQIAKKLVAGVENDLRKSLQTALNESIPRKLHSVVLVVRSNRGETHTYDFPDLQQAIAFMQSYDEERELDTSDAPVLLMESKKKS